MHTAPDITVNVANPQALLLDSGIAPKDAGAALLRAFVLSLYRQDRITSGKAAYLLGVDQLTLIRMLGEDNMPILDYSPDELNIESA